MRMSKPMLAAAAASLAILSPAAAQEETPAANAAEAEQEGPGEAAPEAEPAANAEEPGPLSDLEGIVEELEDQPIPAEGADDAEPSSEEVVEEAAAPAQPAAPAPPLTDAQREQLVRSAHRGRQLFALSQAGFLTTRDMLARVADPEAEGIVGWVSEPEGNAVAVTYYAESEDGPVAVYRGNVLGGRIVSRSLFPAGERPPLKPNLARMAAAREAAGNLERETCGDAPFNVLVVPPEAPDAPVHVYHLTPQTGSASYPIGGNYLTTVGADGEVVDSRGFTESCLAIDLPPVPDGQEPAPIAVTHLLDPMPTEMHVLSALMIRRPLIVVTGNPHRLWLVRDDGIGEIRE